MAWLFRKRESPERKAFREEFESVTAALHRADEMAQVAVGHSINMANSFFVQRFASLGAYRSLSKAEKLQYIQTFTAMEEKLAKQDPHAALGFGLFKMWLGAMVEDDEELIEKFSRDLAFFSRKGDLPV